MSPSRRGFIIGAAGLGLTLPAACSRAAVGAPSVVSIPPARRRAAPVLSGTTLGGTALSVARWAGSPVVVNIWGSWCPPCRNEAPAMTEAARVLMKRGVHFVGLDAQESGGTAAALAYVATFAVPFPSLVDNDSALQLSLAGSVSPSAIPATVVLDARHRIAAVVTGPIGTATTLIGLVGDVMHGT